MSIIAFSYTAQVKQWSCNGQKEAFNYTLKEKAVLLHDGWVGGWMEGGREGGMVDGWMTYTPVILKLMVTVSELPCSSVPMTVKVCPPGERLLIEMLYGNVPMYERAYMYKQETEQN